MRSPSQLIYALLLLFPLLAGAQTAASRDLNVVAGRGELLQFNADVNRVVVAEPKIADAIVVSPREVMVSGKGMGKTTVIIWESGMEAMRYNVNVTPDTSEFDAFQKRMNEEFSGSTVNVTGSGETLVLTGSVKDAGEAKRAAAMASTRAKNVVNLLQTPPPADPRQILLQVKFASIDRVGLSELGFNYFSTSDKALGSLSSQQFQQPRFSQLQFQEGTVRNPTVNFADLLNLFVFRPDLNFGATIRALQGRNLLQILAEPNLIALEGSEASFLAGGEFPFPTLTATTTGGAVSPVVTVQFKKFGIQLGFTPTVAPSGAIHLKVQPEVSALDFANAVTLQGFLIPAVSTRRAETEVILKDGESFAIAGLIDNRVIESLNRVRGLGDIPILGNLFRSRSVKKSTDELLVVITPRFVRPVPADEKVKMPDMMETFLPTVAEQQAEQDAKKLKKKGAKDPAFVGPRGHQEPKP
ncbi:MAG TPA: pilus assembly protein N-terminal domain-containing protein [Bryobacteraceae bacterium]|nr:pilus assembly protein N-terminal domain-containing protein [Bryobacteraceae bacterium]